MGSPLYPLTILWLKAFSNPIYGLYIDLHPKHKILYPPLLWHSLKRCCLFMIWISINFSFFLFPECCVCFGQDTFYFNLKPTDEAVVEGTEQTLLCDVSNRRHIQFHWIHNSKPITNTSRRFQDGSNLRILRVTRTEDSGPFQCIATNVTTGFSLQSGEATLDIQCKFRFHNSISWGFKNWVGRIFSNLVVLIGCLKHFVKFDQSRNWILPRLIFKLSYMTFGNDKCSYCWE